MRTSECKNCHKRFRVLTKEELCAYCYKGKFGKWPKEFTQTDKNYKG